MSNASWLFCDGRRVASLEVADTFFRRMKGLLGRSSLDGAMHITPASSIHTIGMSIDIDVAFCDEHLRVIDALTVPRNRFVKPVKGATSVVEAAAGEFERWGLRVGSTLERTQ